MTRIWRIVVGWIPVWSLVACLPHAGRAVYLVMFVELNERQIIT